MDPRHTKYIVLGGVTLAIIAFVFGIVYYIVSLPERAATKIETTAVKTVGEIKDILEKILSAKVEEKSYHSIGKSAPILEITGAMREFDSVYEYSTTWMGSTKKIHMHARFCAKLGVDATRPIKIGTINKHNCEIGLPIKVLSLEMSEMKIEGEPGWWNKIQEEERSMCLGRLQEKARKEVESDTNVRKLAQDNICKWMEEQCRECSQKPVFQPIPLD